MIRPARKADGAAMVRMAEAFHHATPGLAGLPFSRLRAAQSFLATLEKPDHFAIALEVKGRVVGALLLAVQPYPLGQALLAKEIVFWIDPEHRGPWWRRMIEAGEAWAKGHGAVAIGLSCFHDGRTVKIFERAGYRPNEIVSIKVL